MEKIGIDVHKVSTQVCVLTEDGEYQESRTRTDRDALAMMFGEPKARIVLEASTESEWVDVMPGVSSRRVSPSSSFKRRKSAAA